MPEDLLRTKLFAPPPRSNQVPRRVLLEKLDAARLGRVPFVLVSAPAGFGKTTMLADWLRSGKLPFAWLALDEGDNDPLRFWRYVDAALQTIDSRLGESLRPALSSNHMPVVEQILSGWVNDILNLGSEFVLVLEDYHVIQQMSIHENLNFFLDHLPEQMQLVVATRSDPPLNLARRRGRGQLIEIRASDLRFTTAETAIFLNQVMSLDLSDADIAALGQRTEGWIAGLQMAALSMQDEFDRHGFVAAFNGDDHYIADYLMEEVLQRQPLEFQNFLLQTAILDRLNAPLCDAVTGRSDSRSMLNMLERANLFILPLDNRREWFRYYHLFGELLLKRLREIHSPAEISGLQRNACEWFESHADLAGAIRQARSIPDEYLLLHLLQRNAVRFFFSGELPRFFETASHVPPALRQSSPLLCIAAAWAGLASGHPAEIPPWLEAVEAAYEIPAETALTDQPLSDPQRNAMLEVLAIRLQLPCSGSRAEQHTHTLAFRDLLTSLPPEQQLLFSTVRDLQAVITFNLGLQAEETGELTTASRTFSQAIDLARQTHNTNLFYLGSAHLANLQLAQGHLRAARQTQEQALAEIIPIGPVRVSHPEPQMVSPYNALLHAGLGALSYEWNDLPTAEEHFKIGLTQARIWNQWESLVPLAVGLAHLKMRTGERQAALAVLDELVSPPIKDMDLPLRLLVARLGGSEPASTWLAAHADLSMQEPDSANEYWLLELARLLARLQKTEQALDLIQKIIRYARQTGRSCTLIRAGVVLACISGEPQTLLEALELAEPEGFVSSFIDEGEPVRDMLGHLLKHSHLDARLAAYAENLIRACGPVSTPAQTVTGGLVEELSAREIEVLRYMAEGLSNPEIAGRLYLSPNTLKAHAQNIFIKMDVHNRLQAVTRARELGLID